MDDAAACQRCGHIRQPSDDAPDWQCPACGIAYAKASAAKPTHLEIRAAARRRMQEEKERAARIEEALAKAPAEPESETEPAEAKPQQPTRIYDEDFFGLIAPILVPWLFWFGAFASFLYGVALFLLDRFLDAVLFGLFMPLAFRIATETTIVLFRIHSDLRAIRQHLESKADRP